MEQNLSAITAPLLAWFAKNKRSLSWRQDKQPYHVWVSEIMLQQTRIEAVINYYARFMDALPNVASLAAVEDDALLKLWEGLGYYSRARNLKKAAQSIVTEHGGIFPNNYAQLRRLQASAIIRQARSHLSASMNAFLPWTAMFCASCPV